VKVELLTLEAPESFSRDDLAALFKPFGLKLKRMQRHCPFALFDFATPAGAAQAVALHNLRKVAGGGSRSALLHIELWSEVPRLSDAALGKEAARGGRREREGRRDREAGGTGRAPAPEPEPSMPGVAWSGMLHRTGGKVCELYCRERSATGREPARWDKVVDIRMWVQLGYFLDR